TYTPDENERQARESGDDKLICLTDKNGRWQRLEVSRLFEDPPVNTVMTRYDRDILQHEYVPASPVVIDWLEKYNLPYFQTSKIDTMQIYYGTSAEIPPLLKKDQSKKPTAEAEHEEETIDPGFLFQTK